MMYSEFLYLADATEKEVSARENDWSAYQNVLLGREEARRKVGELADKLESIRAILS